ncbi:MAG: carbohydrate ABC transporter permease [Bacilli bacterium]|jgi:multiple sugar transport system permease protein
MAEHEIYFATPEQMRRYKIRRILGQVILYTFLSVFALFILFPFLYMIITSLKSETLYDFQTAKKILDLMPQWTSTFRTNPDGSIAQTWYLFQNYQTVLGTTTNFFQYYLNTIIVAVLSTAFTVFTSVLAAFAFARLDFKGKNLLFTILLATMMVPGEMMIITNYQTALSWNWYNTYAALILVHGVSIFYIFYLRQTFQQIPNELFLAAKVDGYGHFRYLWRVMIPIAMPSIVTIIILCLMGAWNAYVWPNMIASGNNPIFHNDMKLVSNGLMSLFTGEYSSEDTIKITASMVITLPLLIFFFIFRKFIMSGVSRSGIKG